MKVLYITTDWNTPYRIATGEYGGVGYYRAHGPAEALRRRGHTVDVLGHELGAKLDVEDILGSYKAVFEPYDLVVIKQADTSNVANLIGACKELKIPIAMDLDDLITELDPDNPATETGYEKGDAKQAFAIASLSMVDALFVSTQPLADEYEEYLHRVLGIRMPIFVLPNCIDPTMWTKMKRKKDGYTIIGWQGSITHDNDLKIVLPAIKKLMKKYPKLVFSVTGGVRQDTFDKVFKKTFKGELLDRVVSMRGTECYKEFPPYMARHQWDIGIVPLRDTKFSRGKSHIKWMENSVLGVPTIASDVYPYTEPIQGTDVIRDGETGIISKDKEWAEKLESLILDERKRKYLARDARNFVRKNWTYDRHIDKWEEALSSVLQWGSKSLL